MGGPDQTPLTDGVDLDPGISFFNIKHVFNIFIHLSVMLVSMNEYTLMLILSNNGWF